MFKYYISIARPDHWFKNFFMLPGIILALQHDNNILMSNLLLKVGLGVISICLIASANYVINEWLDLESDKFHPTKKNRPFITKDLKARWVYIEYILLAIVGIIIAFFISKLYLITTLVFLLAGILYNVKPFRTKDKVYLDVISESINNPLRLCMGWFTIAPHTFPPSSILMSYWMGGAFLMAAKRFAEYRFINNPKTAGLYRASFKQYDEKKLLTSIVFYAILSSFFLSTFLIKHKIELILCFPLFSILFAWYLNIAFKDNSPAQHPEKLYKEKSFTIFVIFLAIFTIIMIKIQLPFLQVLFN